MDTHGIFKDFTAHRKHATYPLYEIGKHGVSGDIWEEPSSKRVLEQNTLRPDSRCLPM